MDNDQVYNNSNSLSYGDDDDEIDMEDLEDFTFDDEDLKLAEDDEEGNQTNDEKI